MEITIQNKELIEMLKNNMPAENSLQRLALPRLGMYSQDQTEGKGKAMTVTAEAGTFYIERKTDALDENGKAIWETVELGKNIEATVVYYRNQLSMYDEATKEYTNSVIYDNDNEIIPLFCQRKEIARGTPAELRAKYAYIDKDGKKKSKLQDTKIMYILYKGELYQMTVKGSSMYSFATYKRIVLTASVLTELGSEARENGSIAWNMLTFKTLRMLNEDELKLAIVTQKEIREAVEAEKKFFAEKEAANAVAPTADQQGLVVESIKVDALGF